MPAESVRALVRGRRDLVWMAAVAVLSLVVTSQGMTRSPRRAADEGANVAEAWSVLTSGSLSTSAPSSGQPPGGWLQLALWFRVTGALDRYDSSVPAGREAAVVAAAVSGVLLWQLVRRCGGSRVSAAVAGLLFTASPLAAWLHRMVSLDALMMPWLLLAAVLVTVRSRQTLAWTAAAAAAGVAVLTRETAVLAIPFVVWAAVRSAQPTTWRIAASVAVPVFAATIALWPAWAWLDGEPLPAARPVSPGGAVGFLPASLEAAGRLFDPGGTALTTGSWLAADPALVVAGGVATALGLFRGRTRPWAALVIAHLLVVLRPSGPVPASVVVVLVPFAVLVTVLLVDEAVRGWVQHHRRYPRWIYGASAALATVAVVTAGGVWVPGAVSGLGRLATSDPDRPLRQAEAWLQDEVPADSTVVVDDAIWLDLVRAGRRPEDVVRFEEVDTDPRVREALCRSSGTVWFVETVAVREATTGSRCVRAMAADGREEAGWGSGAARVTIVRVTADRA